MNSDDVAWWQEHAETIRQARSRATDPETIAELDLAAEVVQAAIGRRTGFVIVGENRPELGSRVN